MLGKTVTEVLLTTYLVHSNLVVRDLILEPKLVQFNVPDFA